MGRIKSHRISVCTSCKYKGTTCKPGYEMIEKLRTAIDAAGDAIPEEFEISGVACMAGCDRPCAVAYYGSRKATYLFGDIDPETDINDLVEFARQYAFLQDGWCSSVDRPGKLRKSTLARVPSSIIALDPSEEYVQ